MYNNLNASEFRRSLNNDFSQYLLRETNKYRREDCLKIDLHCHDHNSDIPDELWGRILGLPETWLKTKKLVKRLKKNGCDVITVTNHNNARSCWDLKLRGQDVLTAAEFTCHFDEYNLFVHVLTYGFTKDQEEVLNQKRRDIYDFLRYACAENIPVILPHPLYFYTRNDKIDLTLFEKLAVMFQRFEVLNGQRDLWQSVMTLNWARGLTAEKIIAYGRKHDLEPSDFGVDPYKPKILTGGSDDHMGMFAGECGSLLHVPNLKERLKTTRPSELALEAIREGHIVPFGHVGENQKLNIALLDYFAQIATKIEDPGLFRILFHRGELSDKAACFVISNLLLELQKHKNTRKFFDFIHDALQGKKPNKLIKWKVPKDYRFCIQYLEKIADSRHQSPEVFVETVNTAVTELFHDMSKLIVSRMTTKPGFSGGKKLKSFSTEEITRNFEIPSQITALFLGGSKSRAGMSGFNFQKLVDSLSFPILINVILAGAVLASTRLLYQNRRFLNDFSDHIGSNHHQKRALYLTDTLRDKNGVSNSLSGKLAEIQRANYPIDFLICHSNVEPEPHLHVVRPIAAVTFSEFGEQELRIPDILEIARIFYEGGYDRVICSTEGPMALVSLFLKHMFNVPSYFFMHTDWLDFIKHTTDLNQHERDRIRRFLRVFYKQYNGIFVLNTDHRNWLVGHEMQLDEDKVHLTAHHTTLQQMPTTRQLDKSAFFEDATAETPVLFVACRLSREKGLFDLPEILERARKTTPDLRLVIAGSGPAEEELRAMLPDASFLGWVDKQRISELYRSLDLFVFPSRFDTFGNVILEAFANGMPAISYNCKGPKDIIEHGVNGFLVENTEEMGDQIAEYFATPKCHERMRKNALRRLDDYQAEPIMRRFLANLGLDEPAKTIAQSSVA